MTDTTTTDTDRPKFHRLADDEHWCVIVDYDDGHDHVQGPMSHAEASKIVGDYGTIGRVAKVVLLFNRGTINDDDR